MKNKNGKLYLFQVLLQSGLRYEGKWQSTCYSCGNGYEGMVQTPIYHGPDVMKGAKQPSKSQYHCYRLFFFAKLTWLVPMEYDECLTCRNFRGIRVYLDIHSLNPHTAGHRVHQRASFYTTCDCGSKRSTSFISPENEACYHFDSHPHR